MRDGLIYLDASAFVKLVVAEPESEALRAQVQAAAEVVSAEIIAAEVGRAIRRAASEASVDQDPLLDKSQELLAGMGLLEVDRTLLQEAIDIEPVTVRTLDAIHLAAARALGADLTAFVTYDSRLSTAAAGYGLPVISPT
jgi:predicted nucleic acid-binding protein